MLRLTLWELLSLLALATGLERKADSEQIFFVGNSYTFFWNLPQTVQAMARSQNRSMEVQQSTASGASLEQHWSFGLNVQQNQFPAVFQAQMHRDSEKSGFGLPLTFKEG